MDNKYPANLDPKLREAYDRVMGINVTPSKGKQKEHEKPKETPKAVSHAMSDDQPTIVHLPAHGEKATPEVIKTTVHEPVKQASPGIAIALGIIGVIFLIGYVLLWAQIFGIKILPF